MFAYSMPNSRYKNRFPTTARITKRKTWQEEKIHTIRALLTVFTSTKKYRSHHRTGKLIAGCQIGAL
jgi:hypothetical protein